MENRWQLLTGESCLNHALALFAQTSREGEDPNVVLCTGELFACVAQTWKTVAWVVSHGKELMVADIGSDEVGVLEYQEDVPFDVFNEIRNKRAYTWIQAQRFLIDGPVRDEAHRERDHE